jgi:hypothetical protein
MEIPPPPVPESRLSAWRQTDQTVDSPFSTPLVSVYTHTTVYEETTQRQQIREQTGFDLAWRFFFASRIRLEPPHPPSLFLTSLIRQQVSQAFVERLSTRGFVDIDKESQTSVSVDGAKGVRKRYRAQFQISADALSTKQVGSETDSTATEDGAPLSIPVEGYLTVWADDDYYVAGGAYPSGPPKDGPPALLAALGDVIDPAAAREELLRLIDGCGES